MIKFVPDVVMAANYQSAPAAVQCVVHGEGDAAAIALCGKVGLGISVAEKNPVAKLIGGQLSPVAGAGMGAEPCTGEKIHVNYEGESVENFRCGKQPECISAPQLRSSPCSGRWRLLHPTLAGWDELSDRGCRASND